MPPPAKYSHATMPQAIADRCCTASNPKTLGKPAMAPKGVKTQQLAYIPAHQCNNR